MINPTNNAKQKTPYNLAQQKSLSSGRENSIHKNYYAVLQICVFKNQGLTNQEIYTLFYDVVPLNVIKTGLEMSSYITIKKIKELIK